MTKERRNRTPAERAIIYASVLAGLGPDGTTTLLKSVGARAMNANSYKEIERNYLPYFADDLEFKGPWDRLRTSIASPATRTEIKTARDAKLVQTGFVENDEVAINGDPTDE